MENSLSEEKKDLPDLDYPGEMTLEALSVLDTYAKQCCNTSATAKKLNKTWTKVKKYLGQPYVRDIFKAKLLEKGVTPERIAEVVLSGLDAVNGIYYEGNKCADEPNWQARQRFTQLAAEIFEVLKYQTKVDVSVNNIILTPDERKTLEDFKRRAFNVMPSESKAE